MSVYFSWKWGIRFTLAESLLYACLLQLEVGHPFPICLFTLARSGASVSYGHILPLFFLSEDRQ